MTLSRDVVAKGLLDELGRFDALIRPLSDDEWDAPSRCSGWTVGDVARHVVGSMADVVAGRVDGLGSPEVTAREVAERAAMSPKELADELAEVATATEGMLPLFDDAAWTAPAPGGYEGTLGDGVEALWYDTWLHADDIRAALGWPSEPGEGVAAGISHVVFELKKRGWGDGSITPADLDDPMLFTLVATGRADPSALGEGAPIDIYAT